MMRRLFTLLLMTVFFGLMAETETHAQIQIFSTKLKITVVDALGNLVKEAKVVLYKNQADYDKEVNEVQAYKLTNKKGQVTFKKLQPRSYYIKVAKGDMNNAGAGEKVKKLAKGKLNKVHVVISAL